MKTLRLQLRFLVPLVITLIAAAYLALPVVDKLTLRWFSRDLNLRGTLIANALSDRISEALQDGGADRLQPVFNRSVQDERLFAMGLCSPTGVLVLRTPGLPASVDCGRARSVAALDDPQLRINGGPVHIGVHPVSGDAGPVAELVLLQDFSFTERRSEDTKKYLIILIAALGATIAIITMIVAQLSWRGWISGTRALLRGEGLVRPLNDSAPELEPVIAELRAHLRDLDDA